MKITFKPSCRFDFNIKLCCNAWENATKELVATMREKNFVQQKCFMNIKAKGDFPLLRFTDVRNDQISVSALWERFELTRLNKELLTEMSQSEVDYCNSEKTNESVAELQWNLQVFKWDFGKVPIKYGEKPWKITLTVKNVGGV